MPSRVIALFLAFAMFWSGLSTFEAPSNPAQHSAEQQHGAHAAGLPGQADGSVTDHHLDDLPSQAQSEPPSETPGFLPTPPLPVALFQETARRHAFASAAAGSPFLAGPLRPPCPTALAG